MAVNIKSEGKNVATPNRYKDLDIFFTPHPVTGDITVKTDTDAIRRSVRNIVLTNKYERPFKPNFGGSLRDMLFELDTMPKINRVKERIVKTVETFEPRVNNVSVILEESQNTNTIRCTIFYNINNSVSNQRVEFTLTRAR
ncbi:GPW/gp25 family protein [bacterium]|nr:GPW/gp25 family protein [bacterium]